jgi:hypothetical protein
MDPDFQPTVAWHHRTIHSAHQFITIHKSPAAPQLLTLLPTARSTAAPHSSSSFHSPATTPRLRDATQGALRSRRRRRGHATSRRRPQIPTHQTSPSVVASPTHLHLGARLPDEVTSAQHPWPLPSSAAEDAALWSSNWRRRTPFRLQLLVA